MGVPGRARARLSSRGNLYPSAAAPSAAPSDLRLLLAPPLARGTQRVCGIDRRAGNVGGVAPWGAAEAQRGGLALIRAWRGGCSGLRPRPLRVGTTVGLGGGVEPIRAVSLRLLPDTLVASGWCGILRRPCSASYLTRGPGRLSAVRCARKAVGVRARSSERRGGPPPGP